MKSNKRVWYGLAALAVASFFGDLVCRSAAKSADQARLIESAAQAVARLPETIGPWHREAVAKLDDAAVQMLECRAYQSGQYRNEKTAETVDLTLLVAPAGPLVAHTPEVCYASANFEVVGGTHVETVRGSADQADQFGSVTLKSKSISLPNQLVYYAWRPYTGRWQAPGSPRMSLGGQPMLYKLQLAMNAPGLNPPSPSENNAIQRFLSDSLPVLDGILTSE
jgi:hypothetical protein